MPFQQSDEGIAPPKVGRAEVSARATLGGARRWVGAGGSRKGYIQISIWFLRNLIMSSVLFPENTYNYME